MLFYTFVRSTLEVAEINEINAWSIYGTRETSTAFIYIDFLQSRNSCFELGMIRKHILVN